MNAAHSQQLYANQADHRRSYTAMWLALTAALLLHAFFILVPLIKQVKLPRAGSKSIEIQVIRYPSPAAPDELLEQKAEPVQLPAENTRPQIAQEANATKSGISKRSISPVPAEIPRQPTPTPEQKQEASQQQLQKLAPQILSRQFMSEESTTGNIFGPPLHNDPQAAQKEFHYPHKPNMITMLNKPVPDLPFGYTAGLVKFSYAPGVKGDMQRFWDKITPEFGWRTNYGTQVKCKWILVVAACGWGRSRD